MRPHARARAALTHQPGAAVRQIEVLPGSNFLNGQNNLSSAANEEFNKLNNDPLVMMRAQEQKALQAILSNPLKMKSIRSAVEKKNDKSDKKAKKERKKEKKERKKEKKRAKDGAKAAASSGESSEEER